ncbi:MAG TPA: ABC transporter permease [Candidatus Faecimorpha stercoravium]|nr:ABC transporter permease [Candidatus Faecimorpha stercoravium]
MNNILTILKKELARFFGDKRLAFSSILLPGLMIYIMYTFMGSALSTMFESTEEASSLYAVSVPASLQETLSSQFSITEVEPSQVDALQTDIENQDANILVVFPSDFDEAVAVYDSASGAAAPAVEIYYNSANTDSSTAQSVLVSILDQYESALANKFDVNPGDPSLYDLASDRDSAAMIFSSMLPMLLMIFLFTGCMSVAPESIAGEKERGTIATLLVTPVKRSHIAIGKIIALSIIALLSGISSTLGTVLSMPALMGAASDNMNIGIYTVSDFLLLAVVILSTVLFLVAVISVISAYARTIKEAQSYVTPLMIIATLIGITAMFGGGAPQDWFYYFIPLYNSVQCMSAIFSFTCIPVNALITVASNLIYSVVFVFILTRMFNNEHVVFGR